MLYDHNFNGFPLVKQSEAINFGNFFSFVFILLAHRNLYFSLYSKAIFLIWRQITQTFPGTSTMSQKSVTSAHFFYTYPLLWDSIQCDIHHNMVCYTFFHLLMMLLLHRTDTESMYLFNKENLWSSYLISSVVTCFYFITNIKLVAASRSEYINMLFQEKVTKGILFWLFTDTDTLTIIIKKWYKLGIMVLIVTLKQISFGTVTACRVRQGGDGGHFPRH